MATVEVPAARRRPEGGESLRTVLLALAANAGIAVAKGIAAAVSGSSAMLAEAAHSVADAGNEAFLLVALRRGARPADRSHPLGYGQERFYWSLLAAVGIFVAGGVVALYEGFRQLVRPSEVESVALAVVVLLVSLALEGTSWRQSVRQLRAEAAERGVPLRVHLRRTTDPTALTVFLEDSAAILGILLALGALVLHRLTGSALPDALASLAIGGLLVLLAVQLGARNRDLLIDRAAPPEVEARIRAALAEEPAVVGVPRLFTVYVGPGVLLVAADIALRPDLAGDEVLAVVRRLRERLEAHQAVALVDLTPVAAESRL